MTSSEGARERGADGTTGETARADLVATNEWIGLERALDEREARLSVTALAEQNRQLRQQMDEWSGQVSRLTVVLAQVQAEADALLAKGLRQDLSRATVPTGGGELTGRSLELVDVNESLRMVVINAGIGDGMRHGMTFDVVRTNKPIARIRTVVVRDRITGALIEECQPGEAPRKGDRVAP